MLSPATSVMLASTSSPRGHGVIVIGNLSVMVLEKDRFADLIRKDLEKWGKVVKSAGIAMQ